MAQLPVRAKLGEFGANRQRLAPHLLPDATHSLVAGFAAIEGCGRNPRSREMSGRRPPAVFAERKKAGGPLNRLELTPGSAIQEAP